jgi:hypothetical protein
MFLRSFDEMTTVENETDSAERGAYPFFRMRSFSAACCICLREQMQRQTEGTENYGGNDRIKKPALHHRLLWELLRPIQSQEI